MINFVVLIAVLYDLLWFINVNEQNIKKWAFVISLLKEDETDQAIEEPDEIMHINRDSESKYEKSDRHETQWLSSKLSATARPIISRSQLTESLGEWSTVYGVQKRTHFRKSREHVNWEDNQWSEVIFSVES
ncbi:uncharacterized protein TNCV_1913051 [Trichonephila clavipes]|nr:uncharacterized protein TNCV_1913051 [Trichonephila clavipes]